MKIPSAKSQIPKKLQISSFKQVSAIFDWSLVLGISLGFELWDLEFF